MRSASIPTNDASASLPRDSPAWFTKSFCAVAAFAFLAGWVEMVVHVEFNCFLNMMTGMLLKTCIFASKSCWVDALFFLSMMFSYLTGFQISRYFHMDSSISLSSPKVFCNDDATSCMVMTPQWRVAALFALFFFGGADLLYHWRSTRWGVWHLVTAGSGVVNYAALQETGAITWMMTGHVQTLSNLIGDFVKNRGTRGLSMDKYVTSLGILVAFVCGVFTCIATGHARTFTSGLRFAPLGAMYAILLTLL